jgi:O-antigen/teichoic acid export membrane protein
MPGVARGGVLALGGTAAAAVLGFLLTVVVTRGLSASAAGEFFTVTALFLIVQTAVAFGVAAGVVRFVPRFLVLDRASDIPVLLRVAGVPVAIGGVVAGVALWVAAPALDRLFSDGTGATLDSFRLLALFVLPGVLEIVAVESTRAFRSISAYVLLQQILLPLSRPVLVWLAIAAEAPLAVVVLAWALPLIVALAIATVVVRRALSRLDLTAPPTPWRSVAREYWSFTFLRGISSVIDIALTWLQVLMIAAMLSPAEAAVYAAASRFITAGTLALSAMRLAAAPEISAALAQDDRARASELYRVTTQWVILSSWPLYLVLGLFGPVVLSLFGPGYDSGAQSLAVLCGAMLVALAAGNVGSVLLMGGRSSWVLAVKVLVLVVNVVGNLVLIPRYGILGAAISWALAILVDNIISVLLVHRGMLVSSRGPGLVRAMVLAGGVFGVVGGLARLALGPTFAGLCATLLVGGALYAVLVWRSRDTLDLGVLRAALRRTAPAA